MDINDISSVDTGSAGIDDSLARAEARKFLASSKRDEQKKDAIHLVSVAFIFSMAVLASLVIWTRVLHFVLPESLCWLPEAKLSAMDNVLFHGTVGGAIFVFLAKCFDLQAELKKEEK